MASQHDTSFVLAYAGAHCRVTEGGPFTEVDGEEDYLD